MRNWGQPEPVFLATINPVTILLIGFRNIFVPEHGRDHFCKGRNDTEHQQVSVFAQIDQKPLKGREKLPPQVPSGTGELVQSRGAIHTNQARRSHHLPDVLVHQGWTVDAWIPPDPRRSDDPLRSLVRDLKPPRIRLITTKCVFWTLYITGWQTEAWGPHADQWTISSGLQSLNFTIIPPKAKLRGFSAGLVRKRWPPPPSPFR